MGRWGLMLVSLVTALSSADCHAQWYGRWYGNGGNWGGGSTPYSNAVRAEAALTIAEGTAAESYARASKDNELARSEYLDNQVKFRDMRRQQKAAIEAKKETRDAEAHARVALRPPPKPRTELYPRLSTDQLDPLTGTIRWPGCLTGSEYLDDKKVIEDALRSEAEAGPSDRAAKIIFDAAHRMMTIRSHGVSALGSQGYASCRKFLNSLAIEGDHAREAQR